jgi:hypothetical protein
MWKRSEYKILIEKPTGKHNCQDLVVDGLNIRMHDEEIGLDSSGPGEGPLAGSCEHSNEILGFIKNSRNFLNG